MTDSNNNETIFVESRRAEPPRSRTGILTLLLLTPVALAALGWFSWQQHQTLTALQADYQNLTSTAGQVSSLQQTQSSFNDSQQRLDQQVSLVEQGLQQLQSAQQQLSTSQQQVQSSMQQQLQMTLTSLNDQSGQLNMIDQELASLRTRVANTGAGAIRAQLLAEVQGMLRLAEQRLRIAQDVESAIVIVRSADGLLAQIGDADVAAIRGQLTGDLAALQAVQQVDVYKLHAQLGEAIEQLASLTAVSKSAVDDMQVDAPMSTTPPEPGWVDQTMDFLGQYFVVTQRDSAITPLLSPEQVWFIRKSIELQLQQARLAVLSGDAALFKVALTEAQSAITANLQGRDKEALLSALNEMEAAQLRPQLPSLTATLAAVQQLQTSAPAVAAPGPAQ
ncbi:MAG: uroporphyrinogen-III C-methyltransferase [Pseudomonadota bacterium]